MISRASFATAILVVVITLVAFGFAGMTVTKVAEMANSNPFQEVQLAAGTPTPTPASNTDSIETANLDMVKAANNETVDLATKLSLQATAEEVTSTMAIGSPPSTSNFAENLMAKTQASVETMVARCRPTFFEVWRC